jgi:hypothetical protein
VLSAVATAACDPTGSAVIAINESDHDVVVSVRAGSAASKSVPAHTQGTVYNTFGGPEGQGWSVVVFDALCQRLAVFPIRTNGSTIHIGPDGKVALEPGDPKFVAGADYVTMADARCP